ncbi:MAG: hypothetical protein ACOCZ7_00150, partial [Armatimonadota bacterium]
AALAGADSDEGELESPSSQVLADTAAMERAANQVNLVLKATHVEDDQYMVDLQPAGEDSFATIETFSVPEHVARDPVALHNFMSWARYRIYELASAAFADREPRGETDDDWADNLIRTAAEKRGLRVEWTVHILDYIRVCLRRRGTNRRRTIHVGRDELRDERALDERMKRLLNDMDRCASMAAKLDAALLQSSTLRSRPQT